VEVFQGVDLRQDHHELVPAHPRDRIALADQAGHQGGHFLQQAVPEGVAERVVDLLELVEVEHRDGDLPARALRLGQRHAEAVVEEIAVRQSRQVVVVGHVEDRFLRAFDVRDVVEQSDRPLELLADVEHLLEKDLIDAPPFPAVERLLEALFQGMAFDQVVQFDGKPGGRLLGRVAASVVGVAGIFDAEEGVDRRTIGVLDSSVPVEKQHGIVDAFENREVFGLFVRDGAVGLLQLRERIEVGEAEPLPEKAEFETVERTFDVQQGVAFAVGGVAGRLHQIQVALPVILNQAQEHLDRDAAGAMQAGLADGERSDGVERVILVRPEFGDRGLPAEQFAEGAGETGDG